jgi:hypothetical protein
MQSPSEAIESLVCPFLMTSIVGGHGCLARSNDAIMISPRYVTACCLTGEHAGCSLYRNGDPVALARVREFRYQQSKRLADEHRKAMNVPDETQQVADSPPEEQTPMTSEASNPGAGMPNGHRSESKMSLLDMLRAPTMQELEEGPDSMGERGHRAGAPSTSGSDAAKLPPSEDGPQASPPQPTNAAQPVAEAEPPSLHEPKANHAADPPPQSPTFSNESEPLTLEPAQPSFSEQSGITPDFRAPAEMELFAEIVTVEAEQQWVTLEPLPYEVEAAPAPGIRPVDDSSHSRPSEPTPPEPPSSQQANDPGPLDAEQPPVAPTSANRSAPIGETLKPPRIDGAKAQQEPMASEPAAVVDEQTSPKMAEPQETAASPPVDHPAPQTDTTYSWQPGTVEEIRPSREPRVSETHSDRSPVDKPRVRPATPAAEVPIAEHAQREAQAPQSAGWSASLKGWTHRKIALLALIVILGSGDVITLLPRLTRTQNTPVPARVWRFPEVLGSADQVLLMFSNANRGTITVQVQITGSTGAARKTVRVPTGTQTELALSPGTATASLAISSPAPFLVQRMVMQNNRVQSSYGVPGGAGRASP